MSARVDAVEKYPAANRLLLWGRSHLRLAGRHDLFDEPLPGLNYGDST
jgi:hypothetical protein